MLAARINPFRAALAFSLVLIACSPAASTPPAAPTSAPQAAPGAATAAPTAAQPAAPAATAAPAPPTAAPTPVVQMTRITMASGAVSAVTAPFYVAIDQGIFRKYGIEVEMVQLTGGSQVSQALASGSTQISSGGLGAMLDARAKGADILVIGTLYPWHFFQIYAQPEIKTPQDLRGKTIAASDPGASSDRAIRQALEKYGLVADRDYHITYVGGTRERLLVLEQKVADAAIISPPNGLIAGKQGFNKVVDLVAEQIPFGYSGIAANGPWAKQNPQVVENFFKAYAEAMALAKRDKQLAMQTLSKWLEVNDREVLEESYDLSVGRMPLLPRTERSLVEFMLSLSEDPQARSTDPATLYDNSFIEKVEASGFLKTLPGGQ